MADIHLIKKDSKFKAHKLNWDLVIKNKPYDVYRIPGFIHCIGGKYGENDYWCCPRDEEPTYDNLIEFNGEPVRWAIETRSNNYITSKWGETEVNHSYWIIITRNGEQFYEFGCNNLPYGLAKAQVLLTEISEHPIYFNEIDYDKRYMIGRKVKFRDEPGIITHYFKDQGAVMIEADLEAGADISKFDSDGHPGKYGVKEDIFASSINWFR